MILVSDIHFGANRTEDIQAFMVDVLDPTINPDRRLIIAGDITQSASEFEFEQAKQFVSELLNKGIKVVITPGNHDFGDWVGELFKTNVKARLWCQELLSQTFEQPEVIACQEFDSITQFDQHIFVVLRSTHRGEINKLGLFGNNRITEKQISWAKAQLNTLNLEKCNLHLVTHRSLWKESGDKHPGMIKKHRLEDRLIRHFPFVSYIHGHNHRYVFSNTTTPRLGIPINRLGLPTLSTRNRNWQRGYVRWDFPYDKLPTMIPSSIKP